MLYFIGKILVIVEAYLDLDIDVTVRIFNAGNRLVRILGDLEIESLRGLFRTSRSFEIVVLLCIRKSCVI